MSTTTDETETTPMPDVLRVLVMRDTVEAGAE